MEHEQRSHHRLWSVRDGRGKRAVAADTQDTLQSPFPSPSYAERIRVLLLGCGRGELADLGRLYDETIEWVYPMVCGVTPDGDAAVQLAKDAYQRIWTASSQFDPASSCAVSWVSRQLREQFTAGSGQLVMDDDVRAG
jgi:hypothetical protein